MSTFILLLVCFLIPSLCSSVVAAEYRCSYKILQGLLSSNSEATCIQRQLPLLRPEASKGNNAPDCDGDGPQQPQKKEASYALQIFEEGREAECMAAAAAKSAGSVDSETSTSLRETE